MPAVHVVALAARTPVGHTAEASAAAVRAGISRILMHPFMADRQNEFVRGGRLTSIDAGIVGPARMVALANGALTEMLDKLSGASTAMAAPTVELALPEARPGFDEADAAQILSAMASVAEARKQGMAVNACGRGHAGGLEALATAANRISRGEQAFAIVGGVESYYDYDTLDWLQEYRQLQTIEAHGGFLPGEAAGFVALASESMRRQLHLPSLAIVRGSGVATEPKRIKTDAINLGEGLAQAILGAGSGLRLPEEVVDATYCDINGERYRSEEFGLATLRTSALLRDTDYISPADCWGDVGAASGPLFCTLAIQSWARGYARGPRALVLAGSEGGARAAVIFSQPRAAQV